ncbi:MAG: electron transfer flavoprotein subunit alpha/FixB family protein [Proteobacteria bacterium]|nr:electron transfer flavoprotein subunit alpha/FixB family protein [Pseudomonadota bacterium]
MQGPILILAEHLRGEIADITYEMLGVGRKLADELKVPLHSVVLGKDIAPIASHLGVADSVFVLDHPQLDMPSSEVMAALLKTLIEQKHISLVLIGGTNVSTGIGPKLSYRLNLPFVNFCRNLWVKDASVGLTSQLFGGKILSDVRLQENRGVVSIYPGSFPPDVGKSDRKPPMEMLDLPLWESIPLGEETKVIFKQYIEPEAGDIDITKQDILVSIGRGIANADNIALVNELADALGGAVCASRPVIDQGWLPLSRQVGKSGMNVRPKLYLALGISGAPEHQEGMKNSQLVIAVNTDPKAPIFDIAQYGVVEDLFEIVPQLIEELKKMKSVG